MAPESRAIATTSMDLVLHGELHRDQRGTSLHPEGAHHDPPAVVHSPDHQVGIGPGAGEEALAELDGAGEVRDRPDLHPGLVDRHEQHRQALVPQRRVRMGPAHDVQPVGLVPERRPHLLPVDDPLVPVEPRPARHCGDVGAGVRLAEPLSPDVLDAEDARQEPALLLLGPEREQHRAEQLQRLGVDPWPAPRLGRTRSRRRPPGRAIAPRPPYSLGQVRPSQPPAASSFSQATRTSQAVSSVGLPTPRCAANSPTRWSASHWRTSSRNADSSGAMSNSMSPPPRGSGAGRARSSAARFSTRDRTPSWKSGCAFAWVSRCCARTRACSIVVSQSRHTWLLIIAIATGETAAASAARVRDRVVEHLARPAELLDHAQRAAPPRP